MNQRYAALLVCSIIWFVNTLVTNSLPVLLPFLMKDFSLSYTDIGILVTASSLVYALMQLPAGYIVSRIGSKRILVLGIGILSLFNSVVAMTTDYAQLFVLHVLRMIGAGCHLSVATALISNLFKAQERGKAIGTHESAVSFSGLISPIATLQLTFLYNWRITYLIYGSLGLLVTIVAWKFLPEIEIGDERHLSNSEPTRDDARASKLVLILTMTLNIFVYRGIYSFLPLYLSVEKNILLLNLGYYVAIPHLIGVFGRPIGGYMSDKIGRRSVTLLSLASLVSGISLMVTVQGEYMLLLSLAILGFGVHTVIPVLFAFLMDLFPPSSRAITAGKINTIRYSLSAISPAIIGAVADSVGLSMAFMVLNSVVMANLLIAFLKLKQRENNKIDTLEDRVCPQ